MAPKPTKADNIATGVVLLVAGLLLAWCVNSTSSNDDRAWTDDASVWQMAKKFVRDRLKAPSTADFGSAFGDYQKPSDAVTDLGGDRFRVTGWVDAENAFGAKLRSNWICELETKDRGLNWTATRVVIL